VVLTMTEAVRQKLVFGILEDLLEPNKRSVVNVWSAAQPLSGDEFEQVAEERALAGLCGSAMCTRPLPLKAGGVRRSLTNSTYCSSECEAAVQQLTRGLGTVEAARQRFLQQQQRQQQQQPAATPVGMPPEALSHPGFGPGGVISHGSRPKPGSKAAVELAAARGGGVDVMSATVKERLPAKAIFEPYEKPAGNTINDPAACAQQAPAQSTAALPQAAAVPATAALPSPPTAQRPSRRDSNSRVHFAEEDNFQRADGQQGSQAAAAPAPEHPEGPPQDEVAAAWAAMEAAQRMRRDILQRQQQQAQQQRLRQEQQQRQDRQQQRQQQRQQRQQQEGPGPPRQGPVLVLDVDQEEHDELGQVFGNLQVRDASELEAASGSPAGEPASTPAPTPAPVEAAPAVGDVVFERTPAPPAPTAPASAPEQPAAGGKRRQSRFSIRKQMEDSKQHAAPDAAAQAETDAPGAHAGDASTQQPEAVSMEVHQEPASNRKRRQEDESATADAAMEAEAEAIWANASVPRASAAASPASKAAAGGARGRGRRPEAVLSDTVSERLPGHLGSAVVQQAAALADLAALSGSDGAQFLKQVDGDASDAEEAGSERDSQKGSDSESDTSEQGSYPDALSAAHLEDSGEESDSQMPLPYPEMSPFGRLYTLLDSWVTRATMNYVQGEGCQVVQNPDMAPRAATFSRSLLGRLPTLMQELRIGTVSRGTLERALQDLVATLDFAEAIGSLHVHQWEVALLVMLKSLSFEVVPPLQEALESRQGIALLSVGLKGRGLTEEHFACLLEVLCPDD